MDYHSVVKDGLAFSFQQLNALMPQIPSAFTPFSLASSFLASVRKDTVLSVGGSQLPLVRL